MLLRTALITLSLAIFVIPLNAQQQEPAIYFSVLLDQTSHKIIIDPMFFVHDQQFLSIPDLCSDNGQASIDFNARFLRPGNQYQFTFGGKAAGSISILPPTPMEYPAALHSAVKLNSLQMGLATNSKFLSRAGRSRRSPTESEVKTITDAASKIFKDHGVSDLDRSRMKIEQATIAKFNNSAQEEIIASVIIERQDELGVQDSLFFVKDLEAKDNPSFVWYQHPKSETEGEKLLYVDQIPEVDSEEFVLRRVFYENYSYQVYKRDKNGWSKVFETEVFGCL